MHAGPGGVGDEPVLAVVAVEEVGDVVVEQVDAGLEE